MMQSSQVGPPLVVYLTRGHRNMSGLNMPQKYFEMHEKLSLCLMIIALTGKHVKKILANPMFCDK